MAHQSGYTGSMTLDAGTASWTTTIETWRLRYAEREHEVPVMGSTLRAAPWPSIVSELAQWTARIVFLIPTTVAVVDMAIGQALTVRLKMNDDDYWGGTCVVSSFDVDDPLDGPARGTAVLTGNGALSMTVA